MKIYPISTEKTINLISKSNTIVFRVDEKSTKKEIKDFIEREYGVKVEKVNTSIDFNGKKAYVKLKKEYSAMDLASKLKIL
ncbi:MAG: 50S ribosomal protein L23 [Candidatus Micrarchaeia archaeon]